MKEVVSLYDLREELRRKHSEVFPESGSSTPSELLHYTTRQGFKGIVKSRKMRCSDIRRVNDSEEGDYGLDVIRSVVSRKSVPTNFLNAVRNSQDLFGFRRLWTSYIACFSCSVELPYMWSRYAAEGSRFVIAFDYQALLSGADEGRRYALFPIIYDRQAQISGIEQIVDHAI